jgi:hypothetical protein
MSADDSFAIVDPNRSVQLDSVGGLGLNVVVAVDKDGCEHWGVIDRSGCGNPATGFSMGSPEHEGVGPLPLETVRRIAAAQRKDN